MSTQSQQEPAITPHPMLWGVRKRDLFILPLLSLATVLFMVSSAEVGARILWPQHIDDSCLVNAPDGPRLRPHCESRMKVPEGPWVLNAYNDCGYRTRESCAAKPPNTLRVAVIGSSSSYGYMTPYETAYTTQASSALTRACHRPVEFQNTGAPDLPLNNVAHRFDEAARLHPDLILLTISATDIQRQTTAAAAAAALNQPVPSTPDLAADANQNAFKKYVLGSIKQSRAVYMLQNQLYRDPDTYAKLFLLYGDYGAGYLRPTPSPAWSDRYAALGVILHALATHAQAANIPFVILLNPSASQVAIANTPTRPDADATAFTQQVRLQAQPDHIPVVDPLPRMIGKDPMQYLYRVNGHLGPAGQTKLAEALDDYLLAGGQPFATACAAAPQQAAQ